MAPRRGIAVAILHCPGCGRGGLRVPDGRRGKVTCPSCGAEWFYPETVEVSDVEFRCAHSGARFVVQFSRRSPLHRFVVQGLKQAPPRPSKASTNPALSPSDVQLVTPAGAASQLPKPKSTSLLARLFGKSTEVVPASSSPAPALKSVPDAAGQKLVRPRSHDAADYNWASFFCPYCQSTGVIRCSGGHFTCDGTAELRNGQRFFRCFCGGAGFIAGQFKTVEAVDTSMAVEADRPSAPSTAAHNENLGSKHPKDALPSLVRSDHKQITP